MTVDGSSKFGGAERAEFVRAFVDQAWARPGTDRPVSRVHVAVLVTLGGLAVALLTGVVLQMLWPVRLAAAPVAAPVATPSTYRVVSGWDCAAATDRGFDLAGRTPDWYTAATGGWATDGCHGTFEAIPLPGVTAHAGPDTGAVWWFAPGAGFGRCELAVYLPAPPRPGDAAATTAHYTVLSGRNGSPFATFTVDQTARPGSWYVLGTFPVSAGGIAVRLADQGVPATPTDRLAVTQVRAACTGTAP